MKRKAKTNKPKTLIVYKATRPDGTDFRTGTINYAEALEKGVPVEILDAQPAYVGSRGHGVYVSRTARKTIQFSSSLHRPWRWFKGKVRVDDVVAQDEQKLQVRRLTLTKEIFLADIFGADLAERVQAVRESILTWKTIPWLNPPRVVKDATVVALVEEWREAITPWLRNKPEKLPTKIKIIRTAAAAAADAADADADAASSAASAAAAGRSLFLEMAVQAIKKACEIN